MKLPSIESKVVLLGGGIDMASTPLARNPGFALTAINVEPGVTGGYRRTLGFDRFDGRPRPSQSKGYWVMRTDGATALPAASLQAVTWSGGAGVLLHVSGNDAFIGSDSTPTLTAGDRITIGGVSFTLIAAVSRSARTIDDMLLASAAAADWRRSMIGEVPGIGPVRCVVALRDSVFAIRDQSLTVGGLFKATAAGWQAITDFGSSFTVQDGYGIDDGEVELIRHSDSATITAVAQLAADGATGTMFIPQGQSVVAGNVLRSEPASTYAVTLSAALAGTSTLTADTATNMLGGGTIADADAAGWYAYIGGSFFPVLSYKKKDTTTSTVHTLTLWNPHGRTVPTGTALTLYRYSAFCEVVANQGATTLKAGGRYDVAVHNFYGDPTWRRAYLASGVQRCLELREDGRLIPLLANTASPANDTPIKVEAHADHLFLAYPGGQYVHSGAGNPHTWSALLGANSFAVGDEITGMRTSSGGILMITAKNRTIALYGTGSKDWQQKVISESVGVLGGTLQSLFVPIGLSDRGLVRLDRVQEYGDFTLNRLDPADKVQSIIERFHWHASTQVAAANQYRLYATSGRNLAIKINADDSIEATEFSYGAPVDQIWRYDEQDERNFFTLSGKDGLVYELDEDATSFDGQQIVWLLRLAYSHFGTPTVVKSWRSAAIEQSDSARLRAKIAWSLDYRHGRQFKSESTELDRDGGQDGVWNYSNWNQFYWATEAQDESNIQPLNGHGTSISLAFSGRSASEPNFNLTGLIISYIQRRLQRG